MAKLKDTTIEKATTGGQNQIAFKEAGTTKTQITSNYGDDKFYLYHEGGNRIVINSSGQVGIGTSSPTGVLDVNGALNLKGKVFGDNDGTNSYLKAGTNAKIYFETNGGTRGAIDASGNLGIGTLSPNAQLSLVTTTNTTPPGLGSLGSQFLMTKSDGGTNGNYGLLAGVSGSGWSWFQAQRVDGTATAYALNLQPSGGNVGIGTTAPQQKLQVNGDITVDRNATGRGATITLANGSEAADNYSALMFGNVNAHNGYRKGAIAYRSDGTGYGRGDIYFLQRTDANSSNAELTHHSMVIKNSGKVGIGENTPDGKLTIKQNMSDGGNAISAPHLALKASNTVDNTGFVGMTMATSTADNYGWSYGAQRTSSGIGFVLEKPQWNIRR